MADSGDAAAAAHFYGERMKDMRPGGDEMTSTLETEYVDTVVIGGGQAGLTAGYYLREHGRSFVILDSGERVGDAWRERWDSLRLFTPAQFSGLPGMPFPAPKWSFPTKDEMADYLERYAEHFALPVRLGISVHRLERVGERFLVSAGGLRLEASNVIVATGAHRIPKIPPFAAKLDPRIVQLHSSEYRNPGQLAGGHTLLVGAGNSGAEIAYELADSRHVLLAGPSTGQIGAPHGSRRFRPGFRVFRFLGHSVLRVDTGLGRKFGPKLAHKGDPLIRRRKKDLAAKGIERLPRVVGVQEGLPLLEDDRAVDVANVVWCTGFRTDFGWIDLPVFDEDGAPHHYRGVVDSEPGLYFLGLVFQYSLTSDVLPSQGRDAAYVAEQIAEWRVGELAAAGARSDKISSFS
jgi:putative flavoprotein involved in K+ transport